MASARANFSRIIDSAATTHERIDITRNGSRAAVILGANDYDSLIETLACMNDPELLADLRQKPDPWDALSDQTEVSELLAARLAAEA